MWKLLTYIFENLSSFTSVIINMFCVTNRFTFIIIISSWVYVPILNYFNKSKSVLDNKLLTWWLKVITYLFDVAPSCYVADFMQKRRRQMPCPKSAKGFPINPIVEKWLVVGQTERTGDVVVPLSTAYRTSDPDLVQ